MKIDPHAKTVQLNIRDVEFFNNPYPIYHEIRQRCPIFYWETYSMWSFVSHEDVSTLLRHRALGRQITHILTPEEVGLPPEPPHLKPFYDADRYSLLALEPPDHTRLRGLVQKAFMARQIRKLQPRIAELAHRLIDGMQRKDRFDLITDFGTPIPVIVIAELLGVPTEMANDLLNWSHAMVKMYHLERTEEAEKEAVEASIAFVSFLRELVAERRQAPKDDLISHLIEVEEIGEKLTEDELISTCILLLNAGHEATVNVIGNGIYALLKHRDQLERWRSDPMLGSSAVEELMRFDTPLHVFDRYVLKDFEYKGRGFKQGEKILLVLGAANRDPAVFEDPDRLDIGRKRNPHVSLGGGIHYCLGAPLARLELETSLSILIERLPDLSLVEEPVFQNSYHFHGLERLILTSK
ncbi:MAG: cytochrome P450 [Chloroflexota bacterium]